ncbi:glyoxylate/hydroxypyruvate reductase A [Ignatzschineria rhizosphaerae]|uniref:Glyoxylate/hydroxypyruvate reductase A n=1 Tax=Ignatzschineria rhizosphaerae TaxID=2923279 RepID=A0ABY3X049_9GAMM|nr:glyoxylate/hydroxypyruvate reductase A [Ignatzschineria rhizosphaerae]UNM95059.1 glyoxylate/hydroxypyruvate reductase A [Ignatzschineria rhizosphaerae]
MNILYITDTGRGIEHWRDEFAKADSSLTIYGLDDSYDPLEIDVVLAWKPPSGIFPTLKNLKLTHSLGMGVDHIIKCPDLLRDVPIARIIDTDMSVQMSEYSLYGTLTAFRKFHIYQKQQAQNEWRPRSRNFHEDFKIGILGLGELGSAVAASLYQNGFTNLRGWSKSQKSISGIQSFAGDENLEEFATGLDVLICLLPLTKETIHILNLDLFAKLNEGAYLINPARGEHLVEEDLITALDKGYLSGALLDVFTQEPLPEDHPFWQDSRIELTPHIAAETNPRTASEQVIQNIQRVKENLPALNLIDLSKEY